MSDVKRYRPPFMFSTQRPGRMDEQTDGDYVKYEDYESLQVKLAKVDAERDNETIKRAGWELEAKTAQAALATARRNALEEAAKVCQRISNTDLAATNPPYEEGYSDAADACFHAIRALMAQEEPTT